MVDLPPERSLSEEDAAALVAAQHPALLGPIRLVARGWDNDVFRLGEEHSLRIPRDPSAATLLEKELRWLPTLAPMLPVRVPVPIAVGRPSAALPWAWAITPWFAGPAAIDLSVDVLDALAPELAAVLAALHVPAPSDAPQNPIRGVPLAERDAAFRAFGLTDDDPLVAVWDEGRRAPGWAEAPVWVHGDLHPGNLIADSSGISALIDFGDLSAGDPAVDLMAAWSFFSAEGADAFRALLGRRYDAATWQRARGWAAYWAAAVHRADDARYRALVIRLRDRLSTDR